MTRDGGAVVLDVVEIEGVLVDLATGEAVDLVSLVVVTGLDELARRSLRDFRFRPRGGS